MMPWTSSLETLASFAMAAPMRCTSLAPMCFNTSAASFSPSVSNKMAARSVPERSASFFSIILGHPTSYDLRYSLWILVHQCSGLHHLLLVSEGSLLGRAGERGRIGRCLRSRCISWQNLQLHLLRGGPDQILHQRADH